MKGRFKSPIWVIPVLAMVVALGAFAVMAGINQLSPHPAEANIQEPGQGLSASVDSEKLNEPFQSPLGFNATHMVSGSMTVDNNPQRAGAAAEYRIQFDTSAAPGGEIGVGEEIIFRFGRHFQLPSTIDRNQVTISTTDTGEAAPCNVSDTVNPTSVTLETGLGDELGETDVRLRVPDMVGGDDCNGNQGIGDGATVTVIFQQAAGIENPILTSPGRPISVRHSTDADPGADPAAASAFDLVPVPLRVELSTDRGSRGQSLTLVATGVQNGQTSTFWLDVDGDGVRDSDERDLCSAVASDSVATCTFTVSNPPFQSGTGPDCDFPVAGTFDCNLINVRDGLNRTIFNTPAIFDETDLDRSVFTLRGTVQASPTSIAVGDRVTVTVFDYPAGATIDEIELGGITIDDSTSPTLGSLTTGLSTVSGSGQESFTFEIPGTVDGVRVPTGTQRLRVRCVPAASCDGEVERFTNITIGGASLTLSHDTVIANQDLTITGNGFSQPGGTTVCVLQDDVLLNSVQVEIDSDSLDSDCTNVDADGDGDADNRQGVELSSGGTFTMTIIVRADGGGIPPGLLTAGTHELRVIDSSGSEGNVTVTIPEREIEVTPASARPRDVVTIIGRNFIADNTDGDSADVEVTYDCGADDRSTTAETDASGNFRETLRIPSDCPIPSTNTITADINDSSGSTGIVETSIHEIPEALVTIEPVRGPLGSMVTVSGDGFPTFEIVDSIEFGGRGTMGGRTVNTDAQGNFTVDDILVPGMDPGVHSVIVRVGTGDNETTASTSFEVVDTEDEGVPTDVIPGLATPLGDNLVRAFYFNNTTKQWDFFDPREEFEDANSLHELIEGQAIWVRVMEDQTVELNGRERNLTCVNPGTPQEDCWNLIVW